LHRCTGGYGKEGEGRYVEFVNCTHFIYVTCVTDMSPAYFRLHFTLHAKSVEFVME
jgi:hypothetical protein